jgi:uncharacterized protein (TIGR03083 family)
MGAPAQYAATRQRITALVESLPPSDLDKDVPATPGWRVRDVVAHLVGVAVDVGAGNLDGAATDPWTAAQVDARRESSVEAVLAEWGEAGPALEKALEDFPPHMAVIAVIDAVNHEHDIRGAVNRAGERDSEAVDLALQAMVDALGKRLADSGCPGLRLRAGNQEWEVGPQPVAAAVEAPDGYSLLRALTGRRSEEQIRSFAWEGDPAPYLDVFALFDKPPSSIED